MTLRFLFPVIHSAKSTRNGENLVFVRMLVRMYLRTGGMFDLSTTGFAVVPAAALP